MSKEKLKNIIKERKIPLNTLDVSNIKDMSSLFVNLKEINGSISNWDTSNVTNMEFMFAFSKFNQDISKWNVSNVEYMNSMFYKSKISCDMSFFDISSVKNMEEMFSFYRFDLNLGSWDLSGKNIENIFINSNYSMKKYIEDREKYLIDFKINKENIRNEYIKNQTNKINEELNKEIKLTTLEMEF